MVFSARSRHETLRDMKSLSAAPLQEAAPLYEAAPLQIEKRDYIR